MEEIWIEKYRPMNLSEVVGQSAVTTRLKNYVKERSMPHLLLAGPAGIGKTTSALALAREMFGDLWRHNLHELNASDERGIDVVRGKIKDHLDAIMSRCHYLDLTMDTTREKVLRCKQIVKDGMLNEYMFSEAEKDDVMNFMIDNKDKMREISLRMVTKLADLKKSMGDKWKRTAEVTCMRRTVS